jgi:hypothetical protein
MSLSCYSDATGIFFWSSNMSLYCYSMLLQAVFNPCLYFFGWSMSIYFLICTFMFLYRLRKMSSANGSDAASQPQSPMSLGSNVQSESRPVSGSQPESSNNSEPIPIEIDDDIDGVDDEEGVVLAGSKRKLTSAVWKEFTKVEVGGTIRAVCNYCSKKLSAKSKNGTNHLRVHLKSCVQKKIKLNGKSLS